MVKAHSRIIGSELVDQLAKEAASNRDASIEFNRISTTTLYREIKEETTQKRQKFGKIFEGSNNKTILPNRA